MAAPIKHFRGDTWTRAWVMRDAAGAAIDLTGATARLHLRDDGGEIVASAESAGAGLVISGEAGRIDMRIDAAAMTLPMGVYRFDLEVTYPDGFVRTIEQNRIMIVEDITYG